MIKWHRRQIFALNLFLKIKIKGLEGAYYFSSCVSNFSRGRPTPPAFKPPLKKYSNLFLGYLKSFGIVTIWFWNFMNHKVYSIFCSSICLLFDLGLSVTSLVMGSYYLVNCSDNQVRDKIVFFNFPVYHL